MIEQIGIRGVKETKFKGIFIPVQEKFIFDD